MCTARACHRVLDVMCRRENISGKRNELTDLRGYKGWMDGLMDGLMDGWYTSFCAAGSISTPILSSKYVSRQHKKLRHSTRQIIENSIIVIIPGHNIEQTRHDLIESFSCLS